MKKKETQLTNEDYKQLLAEFRHHISVLGYSNGGQMSKYSNVREFVCWLELNEINEIAQVKPADIMNHYEYLKYRPHRVDGVLKPKTIYHHTKSLRQFFVLLQALGVLKTNPMGILNFTYP